MRHLLIFSVMVVMLSGLGCKESIVHQKSVSQLNERATTMMKSGDTQGAVGRLESAHELMPEEPSILFNLAVAYHENAQLENSIKSFALFIERFEKNSKIPDAVQSLGVVLEEKAEAIVEKIAEVEYKIESGELAPEEKPRAEKTIKTSYEEALALFDRAKTQYKIILRKGLMDGEKLDILKVHAKDLIQRRDEVEALSKGEEPKRNDM